MAMELQGYTITGHNPPDLTIPEEEIRHDYTRQTTRGQEPVLKQPAPFR